MDVEMSLSRGRWVALCERMGCSGAANRFRELEAAYSERHRKYHGVRHILECLVLFDSLKEVCQAADEVEYSIWTHDLVYGPRRSDNEEKSADVAGAWLRACDAEPGAVERIRKLILATRHSGAPATPDEEVLVDIDLHILGANPERFDEYESQIREEYRWVPGPIFRRRRADILRGFLERKRLYHTEECRNRFEEAARSNLRRSLRALSA